MSFQEFVDSYLETALWAEMDNSDPETGGEPFDANYDVGDIAPASFARMRADCERFYDAYLDICPDGDDSQAGHDFWLTRNGHGAGFWDGDWPEHGDRLTELADKFPQCDLYLGDDKRIWVM